MVESNELTKKDFNIDIDSIPPEEQNIYIFNELVEEMPSGFINLEKTINSGNLIYKYQIKGISPKHFSNYENLIELFQDLRDSNINQTEVLEDHINFKLRPTILFIIF